jgi:hypothetical protein
VDQHQPIMPPSPVAQAAQVASVDIRDGVKLSRRDGKVDVVPVEFPPVPVRFQVFGAYRFAIGYREGDRDHEPSGEFNEYDAKACCWAALGLCWRGKEAGLPNFRTMQRDVVAYGEEVTSALWFAGYGDPQQQVDAGRELLTAMITEVFEAEQRAATGFPKAKRQGR